MEQTLTSSKNNYDAIMHAYVISPTSLPAGYKFTASLPDHPDVTFEVQVPVGGVGEGEMFLAPLPNRIADLRATKAPIGRWKDGLFSCLSLGFLHPHLWCAFCCCNILLGQVMTRMKFSWLGQPTHGSDAKNTFTIVIILVISFLVFTLSLDTYEYSYMVTGEIHEMSPMVTLCKVVAYLSFLFWSIYSMTKTRYHIRSIYSIPETRCHGYEDLVVSSCCCCCTVAQMARHSGGYDHLPSTLFSTTGLPSTFVPGIV